MSVEEKFLASVDIINSIPKDGTFQPSEDLMLKLYAYYKQATEGSCNIPQPSLWHFTARIKWNAWNELKNMKKEVAMEKYVEELTKVIETMSYNEKVSRLMSLIGPFYEVVSTEDVDQESDKNASQRSHPEYPYPVRSVEDLSSINNESSRIELIESSVASITEVSHLCSPNSPVRRPRRSYRYSYSRPHISSIRSGIELFTPKASSRKCKTIVSENDLLILAIINLKHSLEDIVKKLDHLQTLAKSACLTTQQTKESQQKTWELGVGGTAFALLWPIAVHFWASRF